MRKTFKFYKQYNAPDCGPTCLRMIANYYGREYSSSFIRSLTGINKEGTSFLNLSIAAGKIGFRTRRILCDLDLLEQIPLPAILHWNQNHFIVLRRFDRKIIVADPAVGELEYNRDEFSKFWISTKDDKGTPVGSVLLLEPSPKFYSNDLGDQQKEGIRFSTFLGYLRANKYDAMRIFMAVFISFLIQLAFPFLTQNMVDKGINGKDLGFLTTILFAQLTLTFTSAFVGFFQSRIQLRFFRLISVSVLSDFWIKLTSLPISFFESRNTGDIFQRIGDNGKVQDFVSGVALNSFFSVLNFIVYTALLLTYNYKLFLIFIAGNILYLLWLALFLRIKRKINYRSFRLASEENNSTIEIVQGIQEIKLNNAEHEKRWKWEDIQARSFKLSILNLNYSQIQGLGGLIINHGKDVIISYIVAKMVITGDLTFGTMMAIQYIIGQLSGPINDFIGIFQGLQDTKISLERLNEVFEHENEESESKSYIHNIPENHPLEIKNLSFRYPASKTTTLKNISLTIAPGKVTAIVGVSGGGKSTLLKLLMKIYYEYKGDIMISSTNFKNISPTYWRSVSGSVTQDGYIFSDTIAKNITIGSNEVDEDLIYESCKTANILDFIESLPNGINTMIGNSGVGISQGQKQRILIARAIYKKPKFLFLDEATNSLDANNEMQIITNLRKFFIGKTVVVVAHRLSTIRDADKIIVLKDGKVSESGGHSELMSLRGEYFNLVQNQVSL